jgi:DNA-directed RNA polymerase subunit K/omega
MSRGPFPAATVALAARTTPSPSTDAVITTTTSDTNSLVVKAFMRFSKGLIDFLIRDASVARERSLVIKRRATNLQSNKDQTKLRSSGLLIASAVAPR